MEANEYVQASPLKPEEKLGRRLAKFPKGYAGAIEDDREPDPAYKKFPASLAEPSSERRSVVPGILTKLVPLEALSIRSPTYTGESIGLNRFPSLKKVVLFAPLFGSGLDANWASAQIKQGIELAVPDNRGLLTDAVIAWLIDNVTLKEWASSKYVADKNAGLERDRLRKEKEEADRQRMEQEKALKKAQKAAEKAAARKERAARLERLERKRETDMRKREHQELERRAEVENGRIQMMAQGPVTGRPKWNDELYDPGKFLLGCVCVIVSLSLSFSQKKRT